MLKQDLANYRIVNRSKSLLFDAFIPATQQLGRKGKVLCKDKIIPGVGKLGRPLKNELLKIHRKQNLLSKFRATLLHKGLGLYLAMVSAEFVGNFIEVRSAENLWGLFSQNQLVSETTFSVVSFIIEFSVALTVFTLSDHYLAEFQEKFLPKKNPH